MVAARAVFLILHVKSLLSVVAFAAKITLIDFAHLHFVGTLGHQENLLISSGAFQPFSIYMLFMAEYDRRCILRSECQISATDFLGEGPDRHHQADYRYGYSERLLHSFFPLQVQNTQPLAHYDAL